MITGADPSRTAGLGDGTLTVLVGVSALLAPLLLLRGLVRVVHPNDAERRERFRSMVSWWVLFLLLAAVLVLGRAFQVAALAVASLLSLRDTLRLAGLLHLYLPTALVVGGAFLWA